MREDFTSPYQQHSYEVTFTAQIVGGCVRVNYRGTVPDSVTLGLSNYTDLGKWITRKLGYLNLTGDSNNVGMIPDVQGEKTQEELERMKTTDVD